MRGHFLENISASDIEKARFCKKIFVVGKLEPEPQQIITYGSTTLLPGNVD